MHTTPTLLANGANLLLSNECAGCRFLGKFGVG